MMEVDTLTSGVEKIGNLLNTEDMRRSRGYYAILLWNGSYFLWSFVRYELTFQFSYRWKDTGS